MAFEICTSSPKAAELASKAEANGGRPNTVYPFDQLNVGQSFTMPLAECNVKSLNVVVSQRNARAKGDKRFALVRHDDLGVVEVARLA